MQNKSEVKTFRNPSKISDADNGLKDGWMENVFYLMDLILVSWHIKSAGYKKKKDN